MQRLGRVHQRKRSGVLVVVAVGTNHGPSSALGRPVVRRRSPLARQSHTRSRDMPFLFAEVELHYTAVGPARLQSSPPCQSLKAQLLAN